MFKKRNDKRVEVLIKEIDRLTFLNNELTKKLENNSELELEEMIKSLSVLISETVENRKELKEKIQEVDKLKVELDKEIRKIGGGIK